MSAAQSLALGRRSPKRAPSIKLASILTGVVPTHPKSDDNLAVLSRWQMLGNDAAGDCVAVTWANLRRLVTAALSIENYPTQDEVWAVYKTQNPGFDPKGSASTNGPGSSHDQGMDIQTVLEWLTKSGGPDGVKAVAFAQVDHTNIEEVKAAIAIFGSVWTGITVQNENMDDFNAGRPWDFHPNGSTDGGHSVVSGGYLGTAENDVRFITWAAETGFTDAFWQHEVEEAWVVIWPEHFGSKAFMQGVSIDALAVAYKALTHGDLPVPSPGPIPVPPDPAQTVTVTMTVTQKAALDAWAKGIISRYTKPGKAAAAWKSATGES